jgi:hypothetical protein
VRLAGTTNSTVPARGAAEVRSIPTTTRNGSSVSLALPRSYATAAAAQTAPKARSRASPKPHCQSGRGPFVVRVRGGECPPPRGGPPCRSTCCPSTASRARPATR